MKQCLPFMLLMPFVLSTTHAAELLVSPGRKATLTVEYTYITIGKKQDKYDLHEWNAKRVVSITADMVAQQQQALPAMHPMEPGQKTDLQNKQTRSTSAQQKMAPMMADMEQLAAKCGDDEGCLEREVSKYANSMQMTPDIKSASKDIEAISKQGTPRYQLWYTTTQRGSYSIDETEHALDGDPICGSQPEIVRGSDCWVEACGLGNSAAFRYTH